MFYKKQYKLVDKDGNIIEIFRNRLCAERMLREYKRRCKWEEFKLII